MPSTSPLAGTSTRLVVHEGHGAALEVNGQVVPLFIAQEPVEVSRVAPGFNKIRLTFFAEDVEMTDDFLKLAAGQVTEVFGAR